MSQPARPFRPSDYVWIARWGQYLGSFDYYITQEQERAAGEKAPLDAIYQESRYSPNQPGAWHTISEVSNPDARSYFKFHYPKEVPETW